MKTLKMEMPFFPKGNIYRLYFSKFEPDFQKMGPDCYLQVYFYDLELAMAVEWTNFIQSVVASRFDNVAIRFHEYTRANCYGDGQSVVAMIESANSEFNRMVNSEYDFTYLLFEIDSHIISNAEKYCLEKIDPNCFMKIKKSRQKGDC